jgi:hypothetical protein
MSFGAGHIFDMIARMRVNKSFQNTPENFFCPEL